MTLEYKSLGLMSGTSGDGVDASIIQSDGETRYNIIYNKYFQYNSNIFEKIHLLKDKILNSKDLKNTHNELQILEREITIFHAKVSQEVIQESKQNIDLVGFHGQTIFHNSIEKISKQLGDAKLLYQFLKKPIIYNFRKNDLTNGGEGAPLAPIFHRLIVEKYKIKLPLCILNIGGISNVTIIENLNLYDLKSEDIGPGNCLIDEWIRKNSKKKYDKNGELAIQGKINKIIIEQAHELYLNRKKKSSKSLDIKDFDVSFARSLSLEDGTATLTEFTAKIIGSALIELLNKKKDLQWKILVCGGGRKNQTLLNKIKQNTSSDFLFKNIDDYNIDGDFVESQAFAYLAIRSYLNLPISFPKTTGCNKPCTGGEIIKN